MPPKEFDRDNKVQTIITSSLQKTARAQASQISTLQQNQNQPPTPIYTNVPQAVNQIYNGEYTQSVGSWNNSATADNRQYECYAWYSHPVQDGQPMYINNTQTGGNINVSWNSINVSTANNTIQTTSTHWLATGTAILITVGGGGATLPSPLITATVYYVIVVNSNTIKVAATAADALAGTPIDLTTQGSSNSSFGFNYTLKSGGTLYSPAFGDWAVPQGYTEFQGDKSLDTYIPGDNIQPGYKYSAVFDIVKRNAYIRCGTEERMWAGLYADQSGTWDWINAPFTITATVSGTVATPTSRDYTIYTTTDRGFSVSSTTVTVANAPSDADFAGGATVLLSWKNVLSYGVQVYNIYRQTGATIVLLQKITTGQIQTLDNGAFLSVAGSVPVGDFTKLVAYTATIPNVLDDLPYVGDPTQPQWATLPFVIKVPQNYDKSSTTISSTVKQWLRWGFSSVTGNLDLELPCSTVLGDATVTSATALFTSDQVGDSVLITYSNGTTQSTTILSYTSTTSIELNANATKTDASDAALIYITDGAPPHSVWADLSHCSYVQGAAFSPNAADGTGHGTPPVAPNGTTQGGSGGGMPPGGIDGQPTCLWENEMVLTVDGDVKAIDLKKGMELPNGEGVNTISENPIWHVDTVYKIVTEKGVVLHASGSKKVFTPTGKLSVKQIALGVKLLTNIDGIPSEDTVISKEKLEDKRVVVQITLKPSEKFLAGTNGYVVCSNRKYALLA